MDVQRYVAFEMILVGLTVALCPALAPGAELLFVRSCPDQVDCLQLATVLTGKRVLMGSSFGISDPFVSPPAYFRVANARLVDLNKDKFLDLVTDREILLNDGTGHFVPVAVFANFGSGGGVLAVDVDADEYLDIVSSAEDTGTLIAMNHGAGGFEEAEFLGTFRGGGSNVVAGGDVTGDGYVDVFAGPGLFASVDKGVLGLPVPIVAADSDWGFFSIRAWFISSNSILTDDIFVHGQRYKRADPLQREEALYLVTWTGSDFDEPLPVFVTKEHRHLSLIDADGDGLFDIAESTGASEAQAATTIYWASKALVFEEGPTFPRAGQVMAGDFDGDGVVDVLIGSSVWWGDSKRKFAPEPLQLDFEGQPVGFGAILPRFIRGDVDGDGKLDISDAIKTLQFLFSGTAAIQCRDAADADDNGRIDISDPIYSLNYLFLGGPALPEPHAVGGVDPTDDELDCVRPHGPIAVEPVLLSRPG
jgi:hypothetical protein